MAAAASVHAPSILNPTSHNIDIQRQRSLGTSKAWVTRGAGAPSTSEPCSHSTQTCRCRQVCGDTHSVTARSGRSVRRRRYLLHATGEHGSPPYKRLANEHDISLSDYMVCLDNPIGLTLAPDPQTGKILVQHVHEGSPAAECKLIRVGDVLKSCSAVFGDEMWYCTDLQRTRWAIMNRVGQVRLLFERSASGQLPPWYFAGKEGIVASGPSSTQLPVKLVPGGGEGSDLAAGRGKCLTASYNNCVQPPSQALSTRQGILARLARADTLRQELEMAAAAPEVDVSSSVARMVAGNDRLKVQMGPSSSNSSTPALQNSQHSKVPFRRNVSSAVRLAGSRRGMGNRGRRVLQLMPWLLLSSSRLSLNDLTRVATSRALSSILELSLCVRDGIIVSAGPRPLTREQGLIQAAAALQRLVMRRQYAGRTASARDRCHVLLHCEEGAEPQAAPVLAAWLHWYRQFEWSDAIAAAEQAVEASAQEPLVAAATELLLRGARERCSRVVLTWPYGGLVAEVSGELVGGWGERMAMTRCLSSQGCMGAGRGHFYLEFKNLRPGLFHYKYIIDDTWALDPYAPRALDESGNWNNVLQMRPPPPMATPEQRLHFVRWEAAHLALAAKLGVGGAISLPPSGVWGLHGQQGQQQQQQEEEEYTVPSEAEYSVPLADLAPPGIVPPLPPPAQQPDVSMSQQQED